MLLHINGTAVIFLAIQSQKETKNYALYLMICGAQTVSDRISLNV